MVFVKLVTISGTGCAEEKKRKDTTDPIHSAMLMAESLNVANGEHENDSSSFQLPPVERNEYTLFRNTDFDEPMYCTSRPQSRKDLQYADRSSNDITSVEAQDKFRCRSDSE